MAGRIILRFRDLVTPKGGTIAAHMRLLRQFGEVWWGWWMRPYESPPRALFSELLNAIDRDGTAPAYLFDSGLTKLHATTIANIRVAPPGDEIGTPDPERSPTYYHEGVYPAWFLLRSIDEVDFSKLRLIYDSFPTRPELAGTLAQLLARPVTSLEQLRHIDVTLWYVQVDD